MSTGLEIDAITAQNLDKAISLFSNNIDITSFNHIYLKRNQVAMALVRVHGCSCTSCIRADKNLRSEYNKLNEKLKELLGLR